MVLTSKIVLSFCSWSTTSSRFKLILASCGKAPEPDENPWKF